MLPSLERRSIGPLSALVAVGRSTKTIVLCHGYGADAGDLAPLAAQLDPERRLTWVFPDAPVTVNFGMAWTGRAWFPIDMVALEGAVRSGNLAQFMRQRPEGLDEASANLLGLLVGLNVPPSELILGGFSQGSMVSLDTILKNQLVCAGVLILSGTVVAADTWQTWGPSLAGTSYLQSHGDADPILPMAVATQLHTMLRVWGWQGSLHTFNGGHAIPNSTLELMESFIARTFALGTSGSGGESHRLTPT